MQTPPPTGDRTGTLLPSRTELLTRVDQLEALAGGLRVAVELQPQVVGGGDKRQPQHGRASEGTQDVGRAVFAVVDLEAQVIKLSTQIRA